MRSTFVPRGQGQRRRQLHRSVVPDQEHRWQARRGLDGHFRRLHDRCGRQLVDRVDPIGRPLRQALVRIHRAQGGTRAVHSRSVVPRPLGRSAGGKSNERRRSVEEHESARASDRGPAAEKSPPLLAAPPFFQCRFVPRPLSPAAQTCAALVWQPSWPEHEPRPENWNCSAESRKDHHGNIATEPLLTAAAADVITAVFKNRWRTL